MRSQRKITGLRALYLRYCYELRIIVKRPTSVKRVSFLLREDVAKLDQLIAQTRFLGRTGMETIDELTSYRESTAAEMTELTEQRQALRNRLRRLSRQGNQTEANAVKAQIGGISQKLKTLRRDMALCDGIAERSGQVKENLNVLIRIACRILNACLYLVHLHLLHSCNNGSIARHSHSFKLFLNHRKFYCPVLRSNYLRFYKFFLWLCYLLRRGYFFFRSSFLLGFSRFPILGRRFYLLHLFFLNRS